MDQNLIDDDIELCVACNGNTQALAICLFSVLNGTALPKGVRVLLTGDVPRMTDFYLEQMASLADFKGVRFDVRVRQCKGVREARDELLDLCSTQFIWMTDDDVAFDPRFLERMRPWMTGMKDPVAWLSGSKGDLNNRRGYKNFNVKVNPRSEIKDGCSYNHFYEPCRLSELPKVHTIDTGCVILDMLQVEQLKVIFEPFPDSVNSGGEDTVFAMQLLMHGRHGLFNPNARAYHLEKPNARFDEFAARAEMVLRVAQILHLAPDKLAQLKREFMPWNFTT